MSSADIDKVGQAEPEVTRGPEGAATLKPGSDGEERKGEGSTATPLVELRGIWKYYGSTPAVRDVNLTVNPGEVVGLVGDNGSGKSTLVKDNNGLPPPYSRSSQVVRQRRFYALAGSSAGARDRGGIPGPCANRRIVALAELLPRSGIAVSAVRG